MLLVRQPKTVGFRPFSKHEYIVPRQPTCLVSEIAETCSLMHCCPLYFWKYKKLLRMLFSVNRQRQ